MKIVLDGYNKKIGKKDNQIVIYENDEIRDSIKASKINDIVISGKGHVTFDALNLMATNNIKMIGIDHIGHVNYILDAPNQDNVFLKKQQYLLSENEKGIKIATEIIKSKIINQKSTLKTLNKNKKSKRVSGNILKITQYLKELENLDKMQIMGIEGKCSVEYWKGVKTLLPNEVNFNGRTQQPTDLVNSMLNYGYAILASEITKYITLSGLDPYCGFLHYDLNKRTSLTFDLIEEFRQQIVDKSVFSLINNRQISNNDLDKRNNLIKLDARIKIVKKILDKIYSSVTYNGETLMYSEIIELQTKKLVSAILDNQDYVGFHLHW